LLIQAYERRLALAFYVLNTTAAITVSGRRKDAILDNPKTSGSTLSTADIALQ